MHTTLDDLHKTGLADHVYTTKEACRILDKDKSTLKRWVDAGRLTPAYKVDGSNGVMLFWRHDIEALA